MVVWYRLDLNQRSTVETAHICAYQIQWLTAAYLYCLHAGIKQA